MKTFGVTYYKNLAPLKCCGWTDRWTGNCLSSTPIKNEKKMKHLHKMGGAHLQCVKNHYAKFELNIKELLELQVTQTRHPLSILDAKMSKLNIPQK